MSELFPRPKIPIADQIKCVTREIKMRKIVYPRKVKADMMEQSEAEREIKQMEAVLETLQWCADNRSAIIAALQQHQ